MIEKINIVNVSEHNEATAHPYWVIIDPRQNFKTDEQAVHGIAGMVTGIWFSREAAQEHLDNRQHAFSKNARVYCASGYWSEDWVVAVDNSKNADLAGYRAIEKAAKNVDIEYIIEFLTSEEVGVVKDAPTILDLLALKKEVDKI